MRMRRAVNEERRKPTEREREVVWMLRRHRGAGDRWGNKKAAGSDKERERRKEKEKHEVVDVGFSGIRSQEKQKKERKAEQGPIQLLSSLDTEGGRSCAI
jgi:hypothetical protein